MNGLEHLIAEKDRLKLVLASIGDGVITVDTEGKIIMMNNSAEKITGYSVDFALHQPIHEVFKIINKNTGEPQHDLLKQAMSKGEIIGLKKNTVLISKEGSAKYISASISPIKVTDQDLGVVIVFRDITKIRQAEENLQRYQLLSKNANDIIIFSDIAGKIIEANQAALIAYGYTKE
ncbi:MAG: PAS domain S-box protein, partial [Bacillota bacterium]